MFEFLNFFNSRILTVWMYCIDSFPFSGHEQFYLFSYADYVFLDFLRHLFLFKGLYHFHKSCFKVFYFRFVEIFTVCCDGSCVLVVVVECIFMLASKHLGLE